MPKISVLMPVYKTKEQYLREAIESVLNQTLTDFEFLILDDCPEDPRENIVRSYQDKRIKYFLNEKNMGISAARNKLIDLAKGKYLAVFDHDDISMPERFEKEAAFLDTHPEIGLVSALVRNIPKQNVPRRLENDADIRLLLMERCCLSHSCAMIRKSVLTQNQIFYEQEFSPAEDYALFCRLIKVTKLHNLQEVLLNYRMHNANTSHTQNKKMETSTHKIDLLNKTTNSDLWKEYQYFGTLTKKIKLCGFFPLIEIVQCGEQTKIYLFHKFLMITLKKVQYI